MKLAHAMALGALLTAFTLFANAAPVPPAALPVAPPPHAAPPDATLVLVEEVPDKEGLVTKRRLVQVSVRNGKVRTPETIWEGDQRFFSHFGGHVLARDRFVVTKFGGVIDLRERKVISSEQDGNLDSIEGPLVYYKIANSTRDEGTFTFNLDTHEIFRVAKPGQGRLLLRGVRSPDGTKSVDPFISTITLHEGAKSTVLGNGFRAEVSELASVLPNVPVMWLDNDHILTQVKNGELVTVDLKGKQTEIVKIPIEKAPHVAPKLFRDPTGRIIYECGFETFEVDVKAKQWARTEWVNLGHGFQMRRQSDLKFTYDFRHNGRDIGEVNTFPVMNETAVATAGYLAVASSFDGSRRSAALSVRIWSAATGEWTKLKLSPNCLIGWVTP